MVTPETLTEQDVSRLLSRSRGDEFARLHRLSIAMDVEREPIAGRAAQLICDAINRRRRK